MLFNKKEVIFSLTALIAAIIFFAPSTYALGERVHYLIYEDPAKVIVYDAASYSIIKEIPFTARNITNSSLSLDRKYLAISDKGNISRWTKKPKSTGKVFLMDLESHELKATIDVGWLPNQLYFSPIRDYLYVLNYGKDSKKHWEYNSNLSVINLETMSVEATINAEAKIEFLVFGAEGDFLYLITEGNKKKERNPSQLICINTETHKIEEKIELNWNASQIFLYPESNLLYVLCAGIPRGNRGEYVVGSLHIIDLSSKSVVTELNMGCNPLQLFYDDARDLIFVLSHKNPFSPHKGVGSLFVVSNQEIINELTLKKEPYTLRSDEERNNYYVVCKGNLLVLNGECSQVLKIIHFDQGRAFKDLVITDDNTKAYLLQHDTTHVKSFDLKENTRVAHDINVGRSGIKFGKYLGATSAIFVSAIASYGLSDRTGSYYLIDPMYTIASPSTELIISPNKKYTYIFNTQTNDITILDYNNDEILDYVKPLDGDGEVLLLSDDEHKLIFLADKSYKIIDLEENTILEAKRYSTENNKPFYNIFIAPFEEEIYLPTKSGLHVFSTNSAKIIKQEEIEGYLTSVLFELMLGENLLQQAELCLRKGNNNRAERLVRIQLKREPQDPISHYLLALAKENQKSIEEALSEYKLTLKYDSTFVEAYLRMGDLYLNKGKADLALECFIKAASHFYKADDYQNAIHCYQSALRIREDDQGLLLKLADCYEQQNLYAEAIETYQKIIKLNSKNEAALLSQTILLIQENKIKQAEANLQKLLSFNPQNQLAVHYLAVIQALKDEKEEAITSFKMSLQLDPEYLPSHIELGNLYLKSDMPDEAITHFEKAIKLGSKDYEVYYNLGNLYLNKKQFKKAEIYLLDVAIRLFQQKNYVQSGEIFLKITQINPNNPLPHGHLACIFYEIGRKELALKELAIYLEAGEIDWKIISPFVNNLTAESKKDYQALGLDQIPGSINNLEIPIRIKKGNIPQIITKADLKFPASINKNELGILIYRLTIDKRGNVEEVIPIKTNKEVEEIIISTIKKWTYQVTLLNGKAVNVSFVKLLDFSNENRN